MLDLFPILVSVAAAGQLPADTAGRYAQWERRLRSRVEALHTVPAEAAQVPPCDVIVAFRVGASGTPRDVGIHQSSCRRYYERQALAVAHGLGRIGTVPANTPKDRRILLKLSYGEAQD